MSHQKSAKQKVVFSPRTAEVKTLFDEIARMHKEIKDADAFRDFLLVKISNILSPLFTSSRDRWTVGEIVIRWFGFRPTPSEKEKQIFTRAVDQLKTLESALMIYFLRYGNNKIKNAFLGLFWLLCLEFVIDHTAECGQNYDFILYFVQDETNVFTLPEQKMAYWIAILMIFKECGMTTALYDLIFTKSPSENTTQQEKKLKQQLLRKMTSSRKNGDDDGSRTSMPTLHQCQDLYRKLTDQFMTGMSSSQNFTNFFQKRVKKPEKNYLSDDYFWQQLQT